MTVYSIAPHFTAAATWAVAPFPLNVPADNDDDAVKCVRDICQHLRDLAGIRSNSAMPTTKEADAVIDQLVQECKKRSRDFFSYEDCRAAHGDRSGRVISTGYVDVEEWARKLHRQGYKV
jgi:hypothetical protein